MADEDELLKAAADDIYRQLADNPDIGISVDPDMVDFLGLTGAPRIITYKSGACRI